MLEREIVGPKQEGPHDLMVKVAVLDRCGVIVAANHAWAQSAIDGHDQPEACGVGASYLDACTVAADRSDGAKKTAAALHQALEGELSAAEVIEIPSYPSDGQHRFDTMIAARTDETGRTIGATVTLTPVAGLGREPVPAGGEVVDSTRGDLGQRLAAETFGHAVQHAIDAAEDGVFMFAPDTLEFLYLNDGAVEQLGYTRDELLTMTPLHIKPEFTDATFRAMLEPLLDDSVGSHVFSTIHRRKDGVDVPVEIILQYPPAVGPGQPRMLVAFVRDITERLGAVQALEASEAAFRTAFDAAPVGLATVDFADPVRRSITDCNNALCELLGYSKEELLTKGFAELTHPDDSGESDAAARRAAAGELQQYGLEKRYIHADGHPVWVWVHSAVVVEAAGDPTRVLVHVADLTARKQADAERERAREWLEGLAEIRAAVLANEPLRNTLELICIHARRLIEADTAIISRPDHETGQMRHVAFDSLETKALVPDHFPIDEPIRQALAGHSFLTDRLDLDDRVDEATRSSVGQLDQVTSALIAPIRSGDHVDALLFMSHRAEGCVDDADLATIESFAAEAATALQLHAARQAQAQLDVLHDRERLARDLHDLVIQRLFAAGMGLQSVTHLATESMLRERLVDTVAQLDQTISELRSTIFRLSTNAPTAVTDELAAVIDDAEGHLGFRPALTVEGDPDAVPEVIVEQLTPTLTEALSNVARHAKASRVDITVTCGVDALELVVVDDGIGHDPAVVEGNGLGNLRSRAERVGGTATLTNNRSGPGATLTWTSKV